VRATRTWVPSARPQRGLPLQSRCAACHTVGHGDGVGPDLSNVTKQRDRAWCPLHRGARPPAPAGDPIPEGAVRQVQERADAQPRHERGEVDAVLEYIELQSKTADSSAPKGLLTRGTSGTQELRTPARTPGPPSPVSRSLESRHLLSPVPLRGNQTMRFHNDFVAPAVSTCRPRSPCSSPSGCRCPRQTVPCRCHVHEHDHADVVALDQPFFWNRMGASSRRA